MSTTAPGEDRDPLFESSQELYNSAPCGYLSTTLDGRIIRVNQTFANWIGVNTGELLGPIRFLDLLTVGGKIFYETHLMPLLRIQGFVNEIALDFVSRQGVTFPCLVAAVQKRDASNNPVLNRFTVFNATERRKYELELLATTERSEILTAELAQANAELAASNVALLKANEELNQFVYAASHDLQEPLRTAGAYAQLLERRYAERLDEDGHYCIHNIVTSTQRMSALIRDLLAFSQAGGSPLVLRRVDLEQPLAAALENLRSTIEESVAVVTYEKLPSITVDAARISQVFQNLVGNAIKYRKPAESPRVHVSAQKEETHHVISVSDNGLGFAPEYSHQIFEMFRRLHSREIAGTGIGLAICKRIVELHGGRIWATSRLGVGSCFSFTIPG